MPTPVAIENHVLGDVFTLPMWQELQGDLNYLLQQGGDLASAATLPAITNEFHNVTGTTTINNFPSGSLAGQRVELLFKSAITVSHNAGGTGNLRMAGSQDASVPANTSISFRWDGTVWWEVSRGSGGAQTTATTIAGLGAGTQGKLGLLRLMPTTYNNGGGTALPAATITVGQTDEFPASGTLTTANGTITYTGKTATTFTGCTGGTGTLAANAPIVLASGTPINTSYDLIAVVYDAAIGKWVGMQELIHIVMPSASLGVSATTYTDIFSTTLTTNNPGPQLGGKRWRAFDAAGLKPQLRIPFAHANIATNIGTGVQMRPSFWGANSNDAATGAGVFVNNGADATAGAESPAINMATNADAILACSVWCNLPGSYTLKDTFVPSIQLKVPAGGGTLFLYEADIERRWVG